ncbi:MAG: pilus assembly protein TadG-related protein [Tepidiformaceae bacterium]
MLVLFALGTVAFIGLVGMAVDMGKIVTTRTSLQKAADAAAFAAAQDLPTAATASSTGEYYVELNSGSGTTSAVVTITSTFGSNDTVRVTARRHVDYSFLKVLGLDGMDVSASATARVGTYVGGSGLLPWAFIASNESNSKLLQNPCYLGETNGVPNFKQNVSCEIKYGAGSNEGGDFGALALGGSGATQYRNNIRDGSTDAFRIGQKVPAETGNMSGPTNQGAVDRFSKAPPSSCPTNNLSDLVTFNQDGTTSIKPGCETHPRIGIIPVVDRIDNPNMSTIVGFSFVLLESVNGSGNNQSVKVRFVEFVTEIPGGIYEGWGGGSTSLKLVE